MGVSLKEALVGVQRFLVMEWPPQVQTFLFEQRPLRDIRGPGVATAATPRIETDMHHETNLNLNACLNKSLASFMPWQALPKGNKGRHLVLVAQVAPPVDRSKQKFCLAHTHLHCTGILQLS